MPLLQVPLPTACTEVLQSALFKAFGVPPKVSHDALNWLVPSFKGSVALVPFAVGEDATLKNGGLVDAL